MKVRCPKCRHEFEPGVDPDTLNWKRVKEKEPWSSKGYNAHALWRRVGGVVCLIKAHHRFLSKAVDSYSWWLWTDEPIDLRTMSLPLPAGTRLDAQKRCIAAAKRLQPKLYPERTAR